MASSLGSWLWAGAGVNLYENLQRLKLAVEQIAPLHGRLVTMADLLKAIGKAG